MNQYLRIKSLVLVVLLFGVLSSNAKNPSRFKDQVDLLFNKEYSFNSGKKLIVFTGSSSILMWKDVQSYFPEYNVINNGFGGSHFSDLLYFYDELILKQNPDILFVYEGDNDIAANKKPVKILKQAKELVKKLQKDLPYTKVVLISPKPSIARWNFKKQYNKLNRKLQKYCERKENLEFADVWSIMLDEKGKVYQDIFLKDGLHMKKQGYGLWAEVISEYLE